ncbi:MAG: methyltransferase domain-containing protein [Polyangiaceae bacterium]|nr:methyltransferase domain-containing protein [Polyangiaceae bacterium]
MLASYARHDYAPLVAGLPIRSGEVVADAGGGTGVLAEMIAATFTDAEVVLLDLPEVGAIAKGRRCVRAIGADLFAPWPLAADVVVFARVLHDWDDEPALTLLRGARAALRPGGRVVILDAVLGPDRSEGGLCDLHVLAVTGGRDRTLVEFETLVARAGLRLRRTPVGGGIVQVVEALKG